MRKVLTNYAEYEKAEIRDRADRVKIGDDRKKIAAPVIKPKGRYLYFWKLLLIKPYQECG
jgi:hypothetical protein